MNQKHHSESPSKYNAWSHCVLWESDGVETDEANAGTDNHLEMDKGIKMDGYEPNTPVARWAVEEVFFLCDNQKPSSEVLLIGRLPIVKGVYGRADVMWPDKSSGIHIADLKTFSDGSENYIPQLKGYATLAADIFTPRSMPVFLHILHGGIRAVETIETTIGDCIDSTTSILESVRSKSGKKGINKFCQYCSHIKECKMVSQAVDVVHENGLTFNEMSLPQKLVVCDAVTKMIDKLKSDAKQKAIDNGGFIEEDGIRYEIKERAGKGRCLDIVEAANNALSPSYRNSDGEGCAMCGITQEKFISICELPKTAFINAMKDANKDRKDIKKKDIEAWCSRFYTKGEPSQYLSRTK